MFMIFGRVIFPVNDGASSRASGPTTRAGSGVKKASTSSTSSLNRTASASSLSKRPVSASRPAVGASRTAPATNKPSSGTVSKALFTGQYAPFYPSTEQPISKADFLSWILWIVVNWRVGNTPDILIYHCHVCSSFSQKTRLYQGLPVALPFLLIWVLKAPLWSSFLFEVGSNKPTSNMKSKPPTGTATTIKVINTCSSWAETWHHKKKTMSHQFKRNPKPEIHLDCYSNFIYLKCSRRIIKILSEWQLLPNISVTCLSLYLGFSLTVLVLSWTKCDNLQ